MKEASNEANAVDRRARARHPGGRIWCGHPGGAKSYQFTGTVESNEGGILTVKKSATETWTFSTDASTKGTAKAGDKVTVYYKMIATEIEAKPAATAPKKK